MAAVLAAGLVPDRFVRLAAGTEIAGTETPAEVARVCNGEGPRQRQYGQYYSATASFLRIRLMLTAEVLLWGAPRLVTGMVFNVLRPDRVQVDLVGAVVAVVGFAATILAQPHLVQSAFPGGTCLVF